MTVITQDQHQTVSTTANGERLEVRPGVTIQPDDDGPALRSTYADVVLLNSGTLQAYDGVILSGDDNRFVNKSHGAVHAVEAGVMAAGGNHATMVNNGEIIGQYAYKADDVSISTVTNAGTMSGSTAAIRIMNLDDTGGTHALYVYNTGLIEAYDFAISMDDDTARLQVSNEGTLRGGIGAIRGEMASALIINDGQIDGSVYLGEATQSSTVFNHGAIDGDVVMSQHAGDYYDGVDGSITGVVYGGAGDDTLIGGYGSERLEGGAGADVLQSAGGTSDLYVYSAARDSTAKAMDDIFTWHGVDKIDLSAIDADKATAGLQHATFGGEIDPGAAAPKGEVVYYHQDGDTFVVLDHTGASANSSLLIQITGEVTLTADSFVL